MYRALSHQSEIAWGAHDGAPEMVLPYSIHYHARGKGIRRTRDRLGELPPPASFREPPGLFLGQNRQEPARRHVAKIILASPDPDMLIARLVNIPNHLNKGIHRRHCSLQTRNLLTQHIEVSPHKRRKEPANGLLTVVQDACFSGEAVLFIARAFTENVMPQKEAVAVDGEECGIFRLFGIEPEKDTVLLIDLLLFAEHGQHLLLKRHCRFA